MDGLVDIHAHVLPGIDDGPEELEESLEMARAAASNGVRTIAATPHLRSDFPGVHVEEIAERCETLAHALRDAGIPLQIEPAAEVSLVWATEASEEHLRLATYGQLGHDLLIETPGQVAMLDQMLHRLQAQGLRIVLAHPERSPEFQREPERLTRLAEQEVLLQVNAMSLLAPGRSGVRRLAERMCRDGLAHVIASDAHRATEWRPVTALPEGIEAAAALVGAARAHWMAAAVPQAITEAKAVPEAPPIEAVPERRGLFRRM